MKDSKVLSSLYYNTCVYPKLYNEVYNEHMTPINYNSLCRSIYHITDLDLFFESDFEDGCEEIIKRVSEKSQYNFGER